MSLALIMCTRGRERAASDFVDGLARLKTGSFPVRAILVDNNDTAELRDLTERAEGLPVTYVHQPHAGLSNARNAGNAALQSEETAILVDDDIVLPADFLLRVEAALAREPKAGVIGGRVELHDPDDLPVTIQTYPHRRTLSDAGALFGIIHGCCLIVRPEARRAAPFFDKRLGAGTAAKSAEDTDFLYRVHRAGIPVVYDPDVFVYHAHGRREITELPGLRRGWARGQGALALKHLMRGDPGVLKRVIWKMAEEASPAENNAGPANRLGGHRPGVWWMTAQRLRGALAFLTGR